MSISAVPGLAPHTKKSKRLVQEPDSEDEDAAERIFAQCEAHYQEEEEQAGDEESPNVRI